MDIETAELVDDILLQRGYGLLEQVQNQVHTVGDDHAQEEVEENAPVRHLDTETEAKG